MMNAYEDVAPPVRSILAAARTREGGDGPITVDSGQSLSSALDAAAEDGRTPVIAEIKPTSPTTEGTRTDDPVALAESMTAAGAAALSVLTEPDHFGGSPETLRRVRDAVEIPVLRKDFLLSESQLDAVAADAVLLIARFLGDDLDEMIEAARDRGFEPLVEVHDRDELERAVDAGAKLIGVNNRDLARLEVDLDTFESVAPAAPDDVTLVAESGISTAADARRMREAGADGLLIGSAIMDGPIDERVERFVGAEGSQ